MLRKPPEGQEEEGRGWGWNPMDCSIKERNLFGIKKFAALC
jgi:hypothetical protein